MASGNRVEELESRVNELEATVDGLTDELVECKVRLRELENAVDAAGGLDAIEGLAESGSDEESAAAEPDVDTETGTEVIEAGSDPISGVESSQETEAEAPKSEPTQDEDETESDESDIIIA